MPLLAELVPMSTEWLYLAAAVLFIVGIRDLSSAETARRGNMLAACGMLLAIVGTMQHELIVQWGWIVVGMVAGGVIGLMMAVFMPMTAMPELTPGLTLMPDTSMPLASRLATNWGPNRSSPTRPTMAVRAPMRAAATAWLAPLPPG